MIPPGLFRNATTVKVPVFDKDYYLELRSKLALSNILFGFRSQCRILAEDVLESSKYLIPISAGSNEKILLQNYYNETITERQILYLIFQEFTQVSVQKRLHKIHLFHRVHTISTNNNIS